MFSNFAVTLGSSNVILLSHSGFIAYGNQYYIVVGEIQNVGTFAIKNVKISITLYNRNNEVLYSCMQPAFLEIIPPNRKSPFVVMWFGKDKSVEVVRYDISDIVYEEDPAMKPQKLEIVWSSYSYPDVIGAIKNIGDKNATYVKVIAVFYDEDGNIVGANSDLSINSLAPNATAEFSVTFPFLEEAIFQRAKKYEVIAESKEYLLKLNEESTNANVVDNSNNFLTWVAIFLAVLVVVGSLLFILHSKQKSRRQKRKRLKLKVTGKVLRL